MSPGVEETDPALRHYLDARKMLFDDDVASAVARPVPVQQRRPILHRSAAQRGSQRRNVAAVIDDRRIR